MAPKPRNLLGFTFGRLKVVKVSTKTSNLRTQLAWKCKCSCGNYKTIYPSHLTSGSTTSCGCYHKEVISNHERGWMHDHPYYGTYNQMINRCYNKNVINYHNYGGRGTRVCKRWLEGENGKLGFDCFLDDLGKRPKGYSIDRIDNNKNYTPNNCRWESNAQQQNNKRTNIKIKYNGQLISLTILCRKLKLRYGYIRSKISNHGLTIKSAIRIFIKTPRKGNIYYGKTYYDIPGIDLLGK